MKQRVSGNKFDDKDNAILAVALKSRKILIIMLIPGAVDDDSKDQQTESKYFILNKFMTEQKPTCLLQISHKFIAVATGFLREQSQIGIFNIFTGQ